MTKKRFIENLKTALIVVLFLATILLLYLLWQPDITSAFNKLGIFNQETESRLSAKDVIEPAYVFYNTNGEERLLSLETANSFELAKTKIKEYFALGIKDEEKLNKEQYTEIVNAYKGCELVFNVDIPFGEFCTYFKLGKGEQIPDEATMASLAFSAAADDSIFLANSDKTIVYRIIFTKSINASETLLSGKENCFSCYTIKKLVGSGETALLPLNFTGSYKEAEGRKECKYYGKMYKTAIAENIFGINFDFVRQMSDSLGNETYMYGYGQKTLNISEDGTCEYKALFTEGKQTGFFEDLDNALAFLEQEISVESKGRSLVLAAYSEEGGIKNKTRNFSLAEKMEGLVLYSEEGFAVEAEITEGQLTKLTRRINIYRYEDYSSANPMEAVNIFAENYEDILKLLGKNTVNISSSEKLKAAAESLEKLEISYYFSDDKISPCYKFICEGKDIYFNMYTGEYLGIEE